MKQSFVKITKITELPYSDIWVYPKGTKAQIKSRIKELGNLGVESISFQGELQFGTISILGKGYVGIVVLGKIGRKKVAVHSSQIRVVIKKVLHDCYKLDRIGLDHGELSRIPKHVIVGNKITIIDFESSSTERRVSNVTSATQAFFIGSGISKTVNRICKIPKKEKIISVLREYKQDQSEKSFENLLNILKM